MPDELTHDELAALREELTADELAEMIALYLGLTDYDSQEVLDVREV